MTMIEFAIKRLPRGFGFYAFNVLAAFILMMFFIAPLWSHFADRSESITENIARLAHIEGIKRTQTELMQKTPQSRDVFLMGREERVVSADLQANLQTIATESGVRFLGVRGLPGTRTQQLHMILVGLDVEGSLRSVQELIRNIESQTPYLIVTSAILRSSTDSQGEMIRAELKVQGAMHDGGALSPFGSETVPNSAPKSRPPVIMEEH